MLVESDDTDTLAVRRLSVRLSGKAVLSEINIAFSSGVTALAGKNGAGKSTLLRTLIGVQAHESGEVLYNGSPATGKNLLALQEELGWMPQEPGFPMAATVRDFLLYAAWLKRMENHTAQSAARDVLEVVNLSDKATTRLKHLSGGQRQRVALAAALVSDPRVVLLDEPTAGLDPYERDHFLRILKRSSSERIVVLSTHLLEDVVTAADRLAVLHDGRIVQHGTLREVLGEDLAAQEHAMTAARSRMIGDEVGE